MESGSVELDHIPQLRSHWLKFLRQRHVGVDGDQQRSLADILQNSHPEDEEHY